MIERKYEREMKEERERSKSKNSAKYTPRQNKEIQPAEQVEVYEPINYLVNSNNMH